MVAQLLFVPVDCVYQVGEVAMCAKFLAEYSVAIDQTVFSSIRTTTEKKIFCVPPLY